MFYGGTIELHIRNQQTEVQLAMEKENVFAMNNMTRQSEALNKQWGNMGSAGHEQSSKCFCDNPACLGYEGRFT